MRRLAALALAALVIAACSSTPSPGSSPEPGTTTPSSPGGGPSPPSTPTPTPSPTPTVIDSPNLAEARALAGAGRFDAAAEAYQLIAEASDDPTRRAEALLAGAVALENGGIEDEALPLLEHAHVAAPAGTDVAQETAFLLARRLRESDRPAEALEVLAPHLDPESTHPLAPFLAAEQAAALAATGELQRAVLAWDTLLAQPNLPEGVRAAIYQERAALAADAGDLEAQVLWLSRYVNIRPDPAGRLALATAAGEAGDATTRDVQLLAVLREAPGSGPSILALDALEAAGTAVDAGLEGFVRYRARDYAGALPVLRAAVEEPVAPADRMFRVFYLAATIEEIGSLEEAVALYDEAAAIPIASPYVHRARWWAARVTEDLGRTADASERYAALVEEGSTGEFTSDAAFRAGYVWLLDAAPSEAIATWDRLAAAEDARLLYWKGRALADTGREAEATEAWERAYALGPTTFHGREAARRIGMTLPDPAEYRPLPPATGPAWGDIEAWIAASVPGEPVELEAARIATELASLGLRDDAEAVLESAAGNAGSWSLYSLLRAAHEASITDLALKLALRLEGRVASEPPRALLRLQYPIAYVASVESLAAEHGFDPRFLAAMVRQESLWDPKAGSIAGALGLTQVIPPTGQGIAAELGLEGFEPAMLFQPALSLRFGAYYLAQQLESFGLPHAALAAYNAGPGNAARWLEASPGAAPEFVETIDFNETYHYVQLVMEHYAHYLEAYP